MRTPRTLHTLRHAARAGALIAMLVSVGAAQASADPRLPGTTDLRRLSGPRFGMTFLSQSFQDSLKAHDVNVGSVITQFGWQFEKQFLGSPDGLAAVNEWIVLIGGLDQGAFLPSASWIVEPFGSLSEPPSHGMSPASSV